MVLGIKKLEVRCMLFFKVALGFLVPRPKSVLLSAFSNVALLGIILPLPSLLPSCFSYRGDSFSLVYLLVEPFEFYLPSLNFF